MCLHMKNNTQSAKVDWSLPKCERIDVSNTAGFGWREDKTEAKWQSQKLQVLKRRLGKNTRKDVGVVAVRNKHSERTKRANVEQRKLTKKSSSCRFWGELDQQFPAGRDQNLLWKQQGSRLSSALKTAAKNLLQHFQAQQSKASMENLKKTKKKNTTKQPLCQFVQTCTFPWLYKKSGGQPGCRSEQKFVNDGFIGYSHFNSSSCRLNSDRLNHLLHMWPLVNNNKIR